MPAQRLQIEMNAQLAQVQLSLSNKQTSKQMSHHASGRITTLASVKLTQRNSNSVIQSLPKLFTLNEKKKKKSVYSLWGGFPSCLPKGDTDAFAVAQI